MSNLAEALRRDLVDLAATKMRLVHDSTNAVAHDRKDQDERRLQLDREQWVRDHEGGIGLAQVLFALTIGAIFVAVGSLFV